MDMRNHPQVFRSWRVERLRNPPQPGSEKPLRQRAKSAKKPKVPRMRDNRPTI